MASYDIWDHLFSVLHEQRRGDVVYVYRLDSLGQVVLPYLLKCRPLPHIPELLRDQYHGGKFKVMIRRGRTMILSGQIAIISL